ncbi:MAG: DUF3732 domain-containing protein [bacterium]|nr:DUF3732 domain-containing protein [bacterium]
MQFTIKTILLWPKNQTKQIRKIEFSFDKINVITGGSEKGKSAIIAIIDYCLGSGHCKIPARTIRDKTEWFGLLIFLDNNQQLLLVRKEPGMEKMSGDMYMKFGVGLAIPDKIVPNCNYNDVKHRLNDLAHLPHLDFEKTDFNSGFQSRPSFRDMVSFNFQPQYIVANQSSLYYKADSSAHREKLKTIFPYILQAVDNEYLQLKEELRDKEREVLSLDKELEKRKKISEKWLGEIRANYITAKEYGLLEKAPYPNDDWKPEQYIPYLRGISKTMDDERIPLVPIGATSITTDRIVKLQEEELEAAHSIQNLRTRQELIRKIDASNRGYRITLLDQNSRLDSVNWFSKKISKSNNCPFCDTETQKAKEYIGKLINVSNEILEKGYKTNDHHTVLNDELDKLNKELAIKEKAINIIRGELKNLQSNDRTIDKRIQTINAIYKFSGQLEADLKNYDQQLNNSDLTEQIEILRDRIVVINETIKQETVDNKIKSAKRKIIDAIKHYAKIFNAANHDEHIELNTKDLTLNFLSKTGRNEALYEIGSGSNYMAYHLSTMLALHEFFLKHKDHPVPNFIVFDQPSQAYFPDTDIESSEKNEDIDRVKKIFEALASAVERTQGKLQIIILEHVGKYAWENQTKVKLIKRWRDNEADNALIPREWLIE